LVEKKKEPVSADSFFPTTNLKVDYQQAGAASWVTAAFGEFATGPTKIPQVNGETVRAGFVMVAVYPVLVTLLMGPRTFPTVGTKEATPKLWLGATAEA
jgi:hypothetical protein